MTRLRACKPTYQSPAWLGVILGRAAPNKPSKAGRVIDARFVLSLNVGQTVWLSFPECCPLGFETKKSHTNLDRWPITVILHVFKWKEIFVRVYLPVFSPLILSMVDGLLWFMCGAGLGCGRKNLWAQCFPSHSYLWLLLDLKCSSHCRVELFRIDQAEFMPRLSLVSWAPQYYPIQERNPSCTASIILSSVTTRRNDELAHHYHCWVG